MRAAMMARWSKGLGWDRVVWGYGRRGPRVAAVANRGPPTAQIPEDAESTGSPRSAADGPIKRAIFGETSARLYRVRPPTDCKRPHRARGTHTSAMGPGGRTVVTASWPGAPLTSPSMKTLIEGGWVVAWNGTCHGCTSAAEVVYGATASSRGDYTGAVDAECRRGQARVAGLHQCPCAPGRRRLDARRHGQNDHRVQLSGVRRAAQGQLTPPPPEAVAALHLRVPPRAPNGSTTIIDVGGLRGDWEELCPAGRRPWRAHPRGPPFRDPRNTFTDEPGDASTTTPTPPRGKAARRGHRIRQGL